MTFLPLYKKHILPLVLALVAMMATLPVLLAQEKATTPAEDFLKDLPAEIKLQKSSVIPRQQVTAFEKKLGGKISRISNSVITLDGKTFQINAIRGVNETDAKAIQAKVIELGSPAPYSLRQGKLVIEYYGMGKPLDRDLVLKTTKLLRLSADAENKAADIPPTDQVIAWVELIDAGKYAESYQGLAGFAKGMVKEADWSKTLSAVRPPLGKVISREIKASTTAKSLPGAPDGHYCVLSFATEFANKKNTTETVAYARESDGTWKAAGYFIQ